MIKTDDGLEAIIFTAQGDMRQVHVEFYILSNTKPYPKASLTNVAFSNRMSVCMSVCFSMLRVKFSKLMSTR